MFSAVFSAPPTSPFRSAGIYQQVGVQTAVTGASPHQLVNLLFEAYFVAVHRGRGAMRAGEVTAKGAAIAQAVRIVDEGLKAALDMHSGGRLAADLAELYAYVCLRLTQANLRNDEAVLDECLRLMAPLHEAWAAISPAGRVGP